MTTLLKLGGFAGLILAAMGGTAVMPPETGEQSNAIRAQLTSSPDCMIKGNIVSYSDEKIYHIPGQEYYDVTEIRPYYGERWFCSEADARQAGWRRAQQ